MPTREQIVTSMIEVLRDSGIQLKHPESKNGTRWGFDPERSAREYLMNATHILIKDAEISAGTSWGMVEVLKGKGRVMNFNTNQTERIFGQFRKEVTNGQTKRAQNLCKLGFTLERLQMAEESLFPTNIQPDKS